METRANYTIVGLFTLIVIAAAFGFIYWMATFGKSGETAQLEIRIPGSASGLSVGAPVLFNGIRVGSVQSLTIDGVDPNFVLAMTEVRASAPVYATTTAKLGIQGLTGQSHIELSGGDTSGPNILQEALEKGSYAQLTADESSVTNLLATAEEILGSIKESATGIQEFVDSAREPLIRTAENAERFSDALAANSDGISDFLESVSSLSQTIQSVSGRLESVVTRVDDIVAAIEPQQVQEIVENINTVSQNVADASTDFEPLVSDLRTAATNIAQLSEDANTTLGRIDSVVAAVNPDLVRDTVDNVAVASEQARQGIASLATVADTIGNRNDEINQIITNVDQLSARLNEAALQVQTTLKKLDGFIGEGDTSGLVAEAKQTLQTIQQVASTINKHIGPIATNIERFTGSGLRDFDALVAEARRSITRVERTITRIGNQPDSLLFGTSGDVKTYNGRRRR